MPRSPSISSSDKSGSDSERSDSDNDSDSGSERRGKRKNGKQSFSYYERRGVGADASDPAVKSLRKVRKALIAKHAAAMAENKITVGKMCDWGVERIDKAEMSIDELEHPYVDAVADGDDRRAKRLKGKIRDESDRALREIHLELIFDDKELDKLGILDTIEVERHRRHVSPPPGARQKSSHGDKKSRRRRDCNCRSARSRSAAAEKRRRGGDKCRCKCKSADGSGRGRRGSDRTPTPERWKDRGNTGTGNPYATGLAVPNKNLVERAASPIPEHGHSQSHIGSNENGNIKNTSDQPVNTNSESPMNAEAKPANPDDNEKRLRCPFCDEPNEEFSRRKRLHKHYRDFCPMLTNCKFCSKIVLISKLNEHQLSKCSWLKDTLKACPKCKVPCADEVLRKHDDGINCKGAPPSNSQWCPLCDDSVPNAERNGPWRQHLLGADAPCAMNKRKALKGAGPPHVPKKKEKKKKEVQAEVTPTNDSQSQEAVKK